MKRLVISVETNGLNVKTCDVIKIGIVALDGLLVIKKIERWYYPKKYQYYIPEINRIDEAVIKEKRAGVNYAKHYADDNGIADEIAEAIGDENFDIVGINVGWQIEFAAQNESVAKLLSKAHSKINLYKKDIKKYRLEKFDKTTAAAHLSIIYSVRKKMLEDFRHGLFNIYASVLNVSVAEAFKEIERKDINAIGIDIEIDDEEILW